MVFGLAMVMLYPPTASTPVAPAATARLTATLDAAGAPFMRDSAGRWWQPIPVAATRLAAAVTHQNSETAAAIGFAALGTALTVAAARQLFYSLPIAIGAGVLMLMIPGHGAFARGAWESTFVVPFVLAWLMAFISAARSHRLGSIGAAAAILGVGFYAAAAAPLMMTGLAIVSAVVLATYMRRLTPVLIVALAVGMLLVPAALVWMRDPGIYMSTFGAWWIHPASVANPLNGLAAVINPTSLSVRVSNYWTILDPVMLLMNGPQTEQAPLYGRAPLLFGMAPLIVLGAQRLWTARPLSEGLGVLLAVLTIPVASAALGELPLVASALPMFPLLSIVSAAGAWYGVDGTNRRDRLVAAAGVLAIAWQALR